MKAVAAICAFQVVTILIMFWAEAWYLSAFVALNCNSIYTAWEYAKASKEDGVGR